MHRQNRFRRIFSSFQKTPKISELKLNRDVGGLIEVLYRDSESDPKKRDSALKALGELRDPKAIDPLVSLLEHDNKHFRRRIIDALGRIGDPAACTALIETLEDDDVEIQKKSVRALSKINDPQCVPALIGLLRTNDSILRGYVIDALVSFGQDAVLLLNEALSVEYVNVSMGALMALKRMGSKAENQLIINLKDPDVDVRWGAAYALGKLQCKRAVKALQEALHDSNEKVRIAVVVSLGIIGDENSAIALAMALVDEIVEVRKAAEGALDGLGVSEEDALLLAIRSDKEDARIIAAKRLGRMSDEYSRNALLEATRDSHAAVRAVAIQSLGKSFSDEGLVAIQSALEDPDSIVRKAAYEVIREFETRIEYLTKDLATNNNRKLLSTEKTIEAFGLLAVGPLIHALDDYLELADEERILGRNAEEGSRIRSLFELHEEAAESAANLLNRITGNYFGLNIRAWKQWWKENRNNYLINP